MFFSALRSKSDSASRLPLSLFTVALIFFQQLVFIVPVANATTTGSGSITLNTNGAAYIEDFDTLANTGTSGALPAGWYFDETGTNANMLYTAGTGSANTGDTYSFGASGSNERAFGTLLSGSLSSVIGAKFTNNTGLTITSLDVSYTGEQWRLGTSNRTTSPTVDKLLFQLSTDGTDLTTGTYTSVSNLDFSSPVTTGTVGALNGNSAANRASVSATVSNLSIANGATFFIRWTDLDASGADDGLAIDDFSITPHGNLSATSPTGTGASSPSSVKAGDAATLTVNVSPGTNPTSTNLKVAGDLTAIGGSNAQQFVDNGNKTFSFNTTIAINTTTGARNLPITITDGQSRIGTTSISLIVNSSGATRDPNEHLLMGNPSNATTDVANENNYLMKKPEYVLSYNRSRAIPNWTSWHLDNSWLGSQARTDTFRADTTLPSGWYQVNENSFSGSGFDRGHMTPSGDRTFSFDENSATFLMTNMIPQAPDNNEVTWEGLESYARQLVGQGNELYIISGGYGQGGTGSNGAATTVDQGRVVVPAKAWKVILVLPDSGGDDVARVNTQTRTIAVIIPNEQGVNADWHHYIVSVDEVEALTGYNFFSNVPDNIQKVIEANADGNTRPIANDQSINATEDSSQAITLTASDAENNPLAYNIQTQPEHGTLSGSGVNFIYTPAPDYHGADSFTFIASDKYLTSTPATVSVNVAVVNDAPVNNVPGAQSVTGGNPLFFSTANANLISISDVDAGANPLQITLTATNGVLTLASTNGLSFSSGDGTADANIAFTGTLDNINAALNGLSFTPSQGFSGNAALQLVTNDQGNTGAGGAFIDTDIVNITVNPGNTIVFSTATYDFNEDAQHALITVNRTGDLSQTAAVDYSSSDAAGLTPCSDANGLASERCDYATVAGTLNFAAGESSKIIFIPIVDDSYVEGPESFTLSLKNAVGAPLGTESSATVTILDNDTPASSNPIATNAFFVRQLYIDFLGREPDPPGYAGWQSILNNCAQGDTHCDRIAVTLGFVQSEEFSTRGYYIFRFYKAALGRNPFYNEFIPDMALVSGFLNAQELEAAKQSYVNVFMNRQEFKTKYDSTLNDPAGYVTLLEQTAQVTLPNKQQLIDDLTQGRKTRADVLRAVLETTEVGAKFYNEAFLVMNYFGFLRRNPDAAYQQWIDLFARTNDYRVITNGFINSQEYNLRFGH
jgi:endonuclease G, mitochondrial